MELKITSQLITFLAKNGINTSNVSKEFILNFISEYEIQNEYNLIFKTQAKIMTKWDIMNRIEDFKKSNFHIPNGNFEESYNFSFEKDFLKTNELTSFFIDGFEKTGLVFDEENLSIIGFPNASGDFDLSLRFKVNDSDQENIKTIKFVVNPNPKSLWKNIASDKDAIFWKEDNENSFGSLGEKRILSSSKRGRSHQNVGSFRDDHGAYKYFEKTGWSVVAVSDGAGSAPLSREGSKIACNSVIEYLDSKIQYREILEFENEVKHYSDTKDEERWNKAKVAATQSTYKAITFAHNQIHSKAEGLLKEHPEIFNQRKYKYPAEYFHATLIVTIFKKFDIGYVLLTFSVGDCPIGIVNKEKTSARLLNWLDVGEFGGGTRFVTQPEIFHSQKMGSRFSVQIEEDFSYLFLMTDGIYDAKFEIEANLDKPEKWLEFIGDLEGDNEDKIKIDFDKNDEDTVDNLSKWMDFWSKGNHDDRTLSIIY